MKSIWNAAFIFGLVFTVIGIVLLLNRVIQHQRNTEQTQGIVVAGSFADRESALMLTFTANGEAYRLPYGGTNKTSVGDVVTVFYNPAKITQNSFYVLEDQSIVRILTIAALAGGIVFMLIGYGVHMGWFVETKLY